MRRQSSRHILAISCSRVNRCSRRHREPPTKGSGFHLEAQNAFLSREIVSKVCVFHYLVCRGNGTIVDRGVILISFALMPLHNFRWLNPTQLFTAPVIFVRMFDTSMIKTTLIWLGSSVLPRESRSLLQHFTYGFMDLMPIVLVITLQLLQSSQDGRWRLIKVSGW